MGSVWLATTDPVYADKTNATAVHAALGLPPGIVAADLGASVRSGVVALLAAARDGGLAVLADRRGGPAGGTDEREGGDAAAAFLFGDQEPLALVAGTASVTAEFIDRWRAPGSPDGAAWEERFGEQRYAELAGQLLAALTGAGVDLEGIARFAVAGSNARAVRAVAGTVGKATGAALEGGDLAGLVGNAGAAQAGLALADLLDAAGPGETLLLISLADGADAVVLRATDAITTGRGEPLRAQAERRRDDRVPAVPAVAGADRGRARRAAPNPTARRPRSPGATGATSCRWPAAGAGSAAPLSSRCRASATSATPSTSSITCRRPGRRRASSRSPSTGSRSPPARR